MRYFPLILVALTSVIAGVIATQYPAYNLLTFGADIFIIGYIGLINAIETIRKLWSRPDTPLYKYLVLGFVCLITFSMILLGMSMATAFINLNG